ncbi:MAG: hypothetical protein ACOX4M_08810 [Acetivibrionales bacterium]
MNRKDIGSNINDGFYQVLYKNDGVYLTVYPPEENGKRVDVQAVLDRLERKKVKNFDKDIVSIVVRKADKTPVKIAEPQEEVSLNATADIMVSPDKMKAYISFVPPENGRMMTKGRSYRFPKERTVLFTASIIQFLRQLSIIPCIMNQY